MHAKVSAAAVLLLLLSLRGCEATRANKGCKAKAGYKVESAMARGGANFKAQGNGGCKVEGAKQRGGAKLIPQRRGGMQR